MTKCLVKDGSFGVVSHGGKRRTGSATTTSASDVSPQVHVRLRRKTLVPAFRTSSMSPKRAAKKKGRPYAWCHGEKIYVSAPHYRRAVKAAMEETRPTAEKPRYAVTPLRR